MIPPSFARPALLPPDGPPHRARRALLLRAPAVLLVVTLPAAFAPRPATAHHGFLGHHDFRHPLYVTGTVIETSFGLPHGRLRVRAAEQALPPPEGDLVRALEDVEGRQTGALLRPLRPGAIHAFTLDVRPSRLLADQPGLLRRGDETTVIAYRRTTRDGYQDELLAVAVLLNDHAEAIGSARMRPRGQIDGGAHR